MKSNVTEGMFIQGFTHCNRENNFSYEGRKALYEYFTEMEHDDYEMEYDPIAVCCEYTEWDSIEEFNENYGTEHEDFDDMADNCDEIVARFPIMDYMANNFMGKCVGEHIIVRDY